MVKLSRISGCIIGAGLLALASAFILYILVACDYNLLCVIIGFGPVFIIALSMLIVIGRAWLKGCIFVKKTYAKYPRTFVNGITTESESSFHKFGGIKKNNDDDCVIAMVSSVPVQGGYGYVNQPVAPGDNYTPNKGEDFEGFLRRDGTVRKFEGILGDVPSFGETELSADKAKKDYKIHWGDGMEWFRNNPPCQ